MKHLPTTIAMLLISATAISAEETDFRLTVSGALASKLAPDTQLRLWTQFSKTSATCELAELHIVLPFEQFKGNYWHVLFSSKATGSSFSVTLSDDLFDHPRVIDVKLDAPRPSIRPLFSLLGHDIRYAASITRRMEYRELPYWDGERQTLTGTRPPTMTIVALTDGAVIHDQPMGEGCVGAKWYAFIDRDIELVDGETYRMSVTYDSGGLFPTITTRFDFTYHSALHGG